MREGLLLNAAAEGGATGKLRFSAEAIGMIAAALKQLVSG